MTTVIQLTFFFPIKKLWMFFHCGLSLYFLITDEQTLGDSERLVSLICCSPRNHRDLNMTEWLNSNNHWWGWILFISSLTIMFPCVKHLFSFFAHSFSSVILLSLVYRNSLHTLDRNLLSVTYVTNTLSQCMTCLFIFFLMSFY